MCENKTAPNSNRSHTSTTVAPPYSSYSINLSALELKQEIVKQADKWRNLPHSTTFCWNLRSWADSQNIKRKQGSKISGICSQFIQNERLVHFAAEALSPAPARSARRSLLLSLAPKPKAAAQCPAHAPGGAAAGRQGSREQAVSRHAFFMWHAPLDQGWVWKQFP